MNIEKTKLIAEETTIQAANDYLELGWVLINHYVIDVSENGRLNQKIRYVLAWYGDEEEIPHPSSSFHSKTQEIIKEMADDLGEFDESE